MAVAATTDVTDVLDNAPEDDEVDFICNDGCGRFLVAPGETAACPNCGAPGVMATMEQLQREAREAYAEGSFTTDEVWARIDAKEQGST